MDNTVRHARPSDKRFPGYSLLEIGIVLLIIGVIVGGLVKGTALLDAAKITNLGTQYTSFRLATHGFADTYGALPGDLSSASQKLGQDQRDGDGNGIVSGTSLNETSEAHHFWRHLRASGWLEGQPRGPEPHSALPTTKFGGLWGVEHNPAPLTGQPSAGGLWFVVGQPRGENIRGGLLTPQQALSLITKYDDGHPQSGHIRITNGEGATRACLSDGHTLDISHSEPVCVAYFKV